MFATELIAPHSSIIYQKYIFPFLADQKVPYVVLRASEQWHQPILKKLDRIFALLQHFGSESEYGVFPVLDFNIESLTSSGFEMQVQCLAIIHSTSKRSSPSRTRPTRVSISIENSMYDLIYTTKLYAHDHSSRYI
ncbi:hypothetical protein D3C73_1080960 [compost metagenome]